MRKHEMAPLQMLGGFFAPTPTILAPMGTRPLPPRAPAGPGQLLNFTKIIVANFLAGAHTPEDCAKSLETTFAMHRINCKVHRLEVTEDGEILAFVSLPPYESNTDIEAYCTQLTEKLDWTFTVEPHRPA